MQRSVDYGRMPGSSSALAAILAIRWIGLFGACSHGVAADETQLGEEPVPTTGAAPEVAGSGPSSGVAEGRPGHVTPATPDPVSAAPNPRPQAGGMDSGGSSLPQNAANTSPDGPVVTTMGDTFVGVRTDAPIAHVFAEGGGDFADHTFLRHYLRTSAGDVLTFEFDYQDGTATFGVAEAGFLSLEQAGQVLLATAGTVAIEPEGPDGVRVVLTDLELSVDGGPSSDPVWQGDGMVTGPVKRACLRARDVMRAANADEQPAAADAGPIHKLDEAWIEAFCADQ